MILDELKKRAIQRRHSQFHPDQQRVFLSTDDNGELHRFKGILCPRRWGKTEGVLRFFGQLASQERYMPFAYIAMQRNTARRISWPILKKLNEDLGWNCHINNVNLEMTWPRTGSSISLFGADKTNCEDLFRGAKWRGVHIDECQSFRFVNLDNLVQSAIMPALADYKGFLFVTGTPGTERSGFFYNLMIKNKYPFFKLFFADAFKNPYTAPQLQEIIETYRQKGIDIDNTPFIRREYFAEWVEDDRYRVISLTPGVNYLYKWSPHPDDSYILGIDFGFSGTSAYVVGVENRTIHPHCLYYVDSFTNREMKVADHVNKIREFQAKYRGLRILGDTAGPAKETFVKDLQGSYGIHIAGAEKTNHRLNVIRLNNDCQGGHIKIYNPLDPMAPEKSEIANQWNTLQKVWKRGATYDEFDRIEDAIADDWEESDPHHIHDAALYVRNGATITYHVPKIAPPVIDEGERMMRNIMKQQKKLNNRRGNVLV